MSKTPRFLFSDPDYFVRLEPDGDVTIGRWAEGQSRYRIPRGHAWHQRVYESTTRAEVAQYHAELVEAFR